MTDVQLVHDGQEEGDHAECDVTRTRSAWVYFTCKHCRTPRPRENLRGVALQRFRAALAE
jgi:hypothetical protein